MMQIEQRILIVGTPSERVTRLCCIFEFLGEQCEVVSNESLLTLIEQSRFRAVVIVNDNISEESIKNIASIVPWQPLLILGDTTLQLSNILGQIEEPFNYPQLTELLHFCQVFGQAKREHTLTSGNQTKLFRSLVSRSEGIANVRHLINQVSGSDATVLVLGQSGTGKEVVARNIHYLSERRDRRLFRLTVVLFRQNCLKANCLAMKRVHLLGRYLPVKAVLNLLKAAHCF
ncbi:sigma 54-interacting transcriptional regulator [Paucibacter sp. O1-1]|nr:sigma 54-interacting transcriptional regulator [Paucibacter sp. O1-1]MDA3827951.1 sigma 54-interacting transcriptional regulator [Paucibacter sp. O1-1]